MGRFVVRRDHPHALGGAGNAGDRAPDREHPVQAGVDLRLARLVGEGRCVLIFGAAPAALRPALEAQGCRIVAGAIADLGAGESPSGQPCTENGNERQFDAVVLSGLLGQTRDPRAILRAVKPLLRPDGLLIVTLGGISAVGGWLAMVDDGPLGTAGSGVLFTEEGLIGLLEASEFAIGHIEAIESAAASKANPDLRDCWLVAYPMPVPGIVHLQRRMRALAQESQEALREVSALRRLASSSAQRLEMLAGHEQRMAGRISELRSRLLEAHAQMIQRDDEIRKTFGDALYQRNALLIERDALAGQRDALVAERDALVVERRALRDALHLAARRLDILRRSPIGLAYRAYRKLFPPRGGRQWRAHAIRV